MAVELGKFPHELDDLPVTEYDRLAVYFYWKSKEDAKAAKKNKRK